MPFQASYEKGSSHMGQALNSGSTIGEQSPEIFLVPSRWVSEFVKDDWSRFMYFLPTSAKEMTHERWDIVTAYLEGSKEAVEWANAWPEDKLVKWGN